MNPQKVLADALALHQSGRYADAVTRYRKVLAARRDHVDALHLMALAQRELGELGEARDLLARVTSLRPSFAEAQGNLGLVCAELGDPGAAERAFRQALALKPELPEVWFNLGNLLKATDQAQAAISCFEEALRHKPLAGAEHSLAETLLESGEAASAIEHFRKALALAPGTPLVWHHLGVALLGQGQAEEAVACLYRATQLQPDSAEAHNDLGNALNDYDRVPEAAACYERALALGPGLVEAWNNLGNALRRLGQPRESEQCFRRALALKPDFAEASLNLGIVLKNANRADEAIYFFRQALRGKPDMVEAYNNLGVVFTERGRQAEACEALETALRLRPGFAEAWNNLGNVHKNAGDLGNALKAFAHAVELKPGFSGAHSNFLFTLNFADGIEPAAIAEAHREWGWRHAQGLDQGTPHANLPDPDRRLKIAYVSPDFRNHACAFFLEPLLRAHHREAVEVYAYAEIAQPDSTTERLQQLVDVWRTTTGLPDEQVAAALRADGIDIVIDLAGHSANNRLLALARKPAPVQVTYLGYPATTGLVAMDWRLTDAVTEPAGTTEAFYTERLYRLPHSLWCYQPFDDMQAELPALPALARGHVTFGSFNSYAKIGPRVVALWATVLRALPSASIRLVTVPSGVAQAALWKAFEQLGVARSRVHLQDRLPREQYIAALHEVDIALDPFPCNGGTTTCDALWMGLPVVALEGNTFLSRASLSVLAAAGYAHFAAQDEHDYIARCVALASDLDVLAAERAGMRARLLASPLLQAETFARDVEAAYRAMWRAWCAP